MLDENPTPLKRLHPAVSLIFSAIGGLEWGSHISPIGASFYVIALEVGFKDVAYIFGGHSFYHSVIL